MLTCRPLIAMIPGRELRFMPTVVSSLMSGLLLLQAVSGWCYERAHIATNANAHPVHCCGHNECDTRGEPSKDPGKSDEKCHGICVFTASTGPQLDLLQPLLANCVWMVERPIDAKLARGIFHDPQADFAHLEPPLRLHLLHQILLV